MKYTIKDGIVYDAKQLLADVAAMVEKQKRAPRVKDLDPIAAIASTPNFQLRNSQAAHIGLNDFWELGVGS